MAQLTAGQNTDLDPRLDSRRLPMATARQHGAQNAILSQNTRVFPAFGQVGRLQRNVALTARIMNLNYGVDKRAGGEKVQEVSNDPLKRDPRFVIQRHRVETMTLGYTRSVMRPAAPQQVQWKNNYWLIQRTRATRPTSIGPYPTSSLPRQSVLYRISQAFSQFAGS